MVKMIVGTFRMRRIAQRNSVILTNLSAATGNVLTTTRSVMVKTIAKIHKKRMDEVLMSKIAVSFATKYTAFCNIYYSRGKMSLKSIHVRYRYVY